MPRLFVSYRQSFTSFLMFLLRWGRRQWNRNPLAAQDGLANRQFKSAVCMREVQSSTVRVEVRAFDHKPIQSTRQSRQERESKSRTFDVKVAHRFKASLRPVLEKERPGH